MPKGFFPKQPQRKGFEKNIAITVGGPCGLIGREEKKISRRQIGKDNFRSITRKREKGTKGGPRTGA